MGRPPTEPGPEAQHQHNASADTPSRHRRRRPATIAQGRQDPHGHVAREPNPNANRKLRGIAGDVVR